MYVVTKYHVQDIFHCGIFQSRHQMENAKVVLSAKLTTYGMPIYKNSAELEVSKIYLHSMWKKLKKKLDHLVNAM